MPDESLMIKFHRGQRGIASACAAQLVLARRHAVNGDKEPTARLPIAGLYEAVFCGRANPRAERSEMLAGRQSQKVRPAVLRA